MLYFPFRRLVRGSRFRRKLRVVTLVDTAHALKFIISENCPDPPIAWPAIIAAALPREFNRWLTVPIHGAVQELRSPKYGREA